MRPTEHFPDDVLGDRAFHQTQPTQPPGDRRDVLAGTEGFYLPLPAAFDITRRYGFGTSEWYGLRPNGRVSVLPSVREIHCIGTDPSLCSG